MTIRNEIFILNKKAKFTDLNRVFVRKRYISRMFIVLLIIITIPINNEKAYAEEEFNNFSNQENNKMVKSNNDNIKDEVSEFFTVDNKIYKVLCKDSKEVILWSFKESSENKDIIVDNQVNYNGKIFEIKYIYDKAFIGIGNVESITIGNNILGFCDSYGNIIGDLDGVFSNKKQLKNIDLGNIECTLGDKCFESCEAMTNVKISKNIYNIKGHCFDKCYDLKNIDLSRIKIISDIATFKHCRELKDIGEFNEELLELPAKTFINCNNLKLNNFKNIKKLGDDCFEDCTMLSQDIIRDVEEIGENCFLRCKFSELYLKNAKKIGDNAFGGMESLRKIRFGNSNIPLLGIDIVMGSKVNEWIYPKEYITQPEYSSFLNKLKVSRVIWNYNYGNFNSSVTQGVKLNSLTPPKTNIERAGYEIEGWYKEQGCINKVNKIADLGEIIDSDLVIKNPELYAKWREIKESKSGEPEKPKAEEEPKKSIEPEKPKPEEEPKKPIEPEKPKPGEEPTKPKPEEGPEKPSQTNKPIPAEPQRSKIEEKVTKPKKKNKFKKKVNLNKNNINITEYENNEFLRKLRSKLNGKNYIKDFNMIFNNKNKHIKLEKTIILSLDYEIAKIFIFSIAGKCNAKIEVLNWSYTDNINNNIEITKNGALGQITENNEYIGIYLNKINDGTKGAMKIGWNKIDNEWYYLKSNGVLAINEVIDGYSVGSDGKLI